MTKVKIPAEVAKLARKNEKQSSNFFRIKKLDPGTFDRDYPLWVAPNKYKKRLTKRLKQYVTEIEGIELVKQEHTIVDTGFFVLMGGLLNCAFSWDSTKILNLLYGIFNRHLAPCTKY